MDNQAKTDPALQAQLQELVKEAGSQAKAAKLLNKSSAAISTYLSGRYAGDLAGFERMLKEYFGNRAAAQGMTSAQVITGDYVGTSISTDVYQIIRLANLKGGLYTACGDAGIGKTMACEQYVRDYPSAAVYVTVNPSLATCRAFLRLLCRKLRLQQGCRDDMWMRICDYFAGGPKVLIIDEAQHLPLRTIEDIRALYDNNPQLGICFIGNVDTVTRTGGKGMDAFAQLRNRTRLTEIYHTAQITIDDMRLLYPRLVSDQEALKVMHAIARSDQAIRGATNVYGNALDNGDVSAAGLVSMARQMKIRI